ncbi:spore gernimation protein GerD, partial [Klebsiella pneumoniae]
MRNILLAAMIFVLTAACSSPAQRPESRGPDYQQVKEIVVDVLQTNEGKRAIKEMMKDPEFKREVVIAT